MALAAASRMLIGVYEPENDHEKLLYEHLVEMTHMMEEKLRKEQVQYSMKLTAPASLAFYQIWQQCNQYTDTYSQVIILETIKQIDKTSKAPKRQTI